MTQSFRVMSRFTPALLTQPGAYSFMNFASLSAFFAGNQSLAVRYFCDGMLMAGLIRLLTGRPVQRVSFDFTSIADTVFSQAASAQLKVFVIGAESAQIGAFVDKISQRYDKLPLAGWRDGYFSAAQQDEVCRQIQASGAQLVIAGLGAGKQEQFLAALLAQGFDGVAFSCGGFIRQEATSRRDYYPPLVDKLGLRAFYRMYKEPHTIRRYLLDYPQNLLKFVWQFYRRQLQVELDAVQ